MRTTSPLRTWRSMSDSGGVGDRRVDLDAAVHRPRVHDLLAGPEPLGRHAPARGVLAQARDVVRALEHPLALHAEDVDDVGVLDVVDVVRDLAAHRLDPARDQRRRADERHPRAHEHERLDVRAGDARVEDVADDRDVEALDPAELLVDRVEVEERLRRVLVLAVAGVDDVRRRVAGDELRRADVRVADDDHVRVVGADRERRVLQRLALVDRRAGRLDRHHVGREPLRGELEARRRPRRRLEEEVDDRAAAERRQLLHVALERARERAGEREEPLDVLPGQVGDRDQVPARPSSSAAGARRGAGDGRLPSASSLLRGWDEQDAVDLVDLDELHLDALVAARSGGSCRRSRGGSGARGGRGRRARRAGRARDGRTRRGPRSRRGSSARCRGRRRTRTQVIPSRGKSSRVARTTGCGCSGAAAAARRGRRRGER